MKDKLYIKTKLDNILTEIIPQSTDQKYIHNQLVENLMWLYNNGNLRTDDELKLRINAKEEELIGYNFANYHGIEVKANETVIFNLKDLF